MIGYFIGPGTMLVEADTLFEIDGVGLGLTDLVGVLVLVLVGVLGELVV